MNRKYLQLCLIVASTFLLFVKAPGQNIDIMTYNIRYDNPEDSVNNWNQRKKSMSEMLNRYHPWIIGIQEGLHHQLTYLDSSLTNYKYIGIGREDGKEKGEYCAIFYDTTRFTVIEHSTFWLSEMSSTISVGWDAALERICTYALFEIISTKKKLWVFNTHFDHMGENARENSADLILDKIKKLNSDNLPLVLMGDLNCTPDSKPIKILRARLDNASEISQKPMTGPDGTYSGFNMNDSINKRVDYIFTDNVMVMFYKHLDEKRENGYFISDHRPVLAGIRISK